MVPAAFVLLEALPLTPSGKIDRRALPAVETIMSARDGAGGAAHIHRRAAGGHLGPGAKAVPGGHPRELFDLGGHSLLATQVMAQIRAALGVTVPLQRLFERPTIAGLAAEIDTLHREAQGRLAVPIVPVTRSEMLPLSFSQERLWFLDELVPVNNFYNFPIPLRLRGNVHLPTLARSVDALCARHEALRTTYAGVAGRPVQVIAPAGAGALAAAGSQRTRPRST